VFGAIGVSGVLVALWVALRRPSDARLVTALEQVDRRLDGIEEQISSARPRGRDAALDSIGWTVELGEVLRRTLAAAGALRAVDASRVGVRRPDGTVAVAVDGRIDEKAAAFLGPPDGAPFAFGRASWEVESHDGLRAGLVVPLGDERSGSLAVYSRLEDAFDHEAAELLASIAQRAAPAVRNALQFLVVQELAATDSRTGLGSASAFDEALQREFSAARRHGRPLCLVQIDLDDFGAINKNHSLITGDEVLAEFGARVRSTIRGSDAAFRNSGGADEFFLILPETTREFAELLYGRIRFEMTARPFDGVGPVTMSSGLAELRPEDTIESLRQRAAGAQRLAKNDGKDRIVTDADGRLAVP